MSETGPPPLPPTRVRIVIVYFSTWADGPQDARE